MSIKRFFELVYLLNFLILVFFFLSASQSDASDRQFVIDVQTHYFWMV